MALPTKYMKSSRFVNTDILELQQVNRKPISGYQDLSVVSLEETVERIIPFVPHVMDYATKAKQRCKHSGTLTVNESSAIYLYTMSQPFYCILNKVLRAENPRALEPWLPFMKLFISALEKLPSQLTTVWRGIRNNNVLEYAEDDVFTWHGVNSCSSKINVAGNFVDQRGILFCIETIHGKNITMYSANQDEEEVVLMPGTCLRVSSTITEPNSLSIIHLQEW